MVGVLIEIETKKNEKKKARGSSQAVVLIVEHLAAVLRARLRWSDAEVLTSGVVGDASMI